VLAAGLGTRLRPLTLVRAKPAIPVAGTPIIRRIIAWLVQNGVTDVVVNLHHLPATLTAVVGDGSDIGAAVRFSWEQPIVLGSAGGVRQALEILGVDRFFIVNGDTLTDVDLAALSRSHEEAQSLVTLALTPNTDSRRYGGVRLNPHNRVVGFVPAGYSAKQGSWHFVGVQIVQARAFAELAGGRPANTIGGLYDTLISNRPGALSGFVSDAAFWDVGTVADYISTCRAFENDRAPTQSVRVDATARVRDSIFWDNIEIAANASLEDCIVTDDVHVPAGATYRQSILWNEAGLLVATRIGLPC
jgi:NDP-sugar pyrophosphorylase family protein